MPCGTKRTRKVHKRSLRKSRKRVLIRRREKYRGGT